MGGSINVIRRLQRLVDFFLTKNLDMYLRIMLEINLLMHNVVASEGHLMTRSH